MVAMRTRYCFLRRHLQCRLIKTNGSQAVVIVKWKANTLPFRFPSVRRAIELVAFATWRWRSRAASADPAGKAPWKQTADDWYAYRCRLDDALRRVLPEWVASECLVVYDEDVTTPS